MSAILVNIMHRYQYAEENGIALCKCGCGEQTTRDGRRYALYRHGHNPQFGLRKSFDGKTIDMDYYRVLYDAHHPRNKKRHMFEHDIIMERKLGRHLTADEDVHHINGNKLDNRIENLELLNHGEHTEQHWRQRKCARGS